MRKYIPLYKNTFKKLSLLFFAIQFLCVVSFGNDVKAQNHQNKMVINDQLFIDDDVETDSLIYGWGGGMTIQIDSAEYSRYYHIVQPYVTPYDWEVQFAFVSKYDYQIGGEYTLEMDVKGSDNTSLRTAFLSLDENNEYFNPGVFGYVDVSTNWEHVKLTAQCDLSPTQFIVSNIGNFIGQLFIDNVKVYCSGFSRDYEHLYDSLCYVRDFDDSNWQAFYVPFAMNYEDWKTDFEIASILGIKQFDTDGDGIPDQTIMEIEKLNSGNINPNEPYFIRSLEVGCKTIKLKDSFFFRTDENTTNITYNNNKYEITGTYRMKTNEEMVDNLIYTPINGSVSIPSINQSNLSPFRWYMSVMDVDGMRQDVGIVQIKEIGQDLGISTLNIHDFQMNDVNTLYGTPADPKIKGLVVSRNKIFFVR